MKDPDETASLLDQLFGWKIRWQSEDEGGSQTIHVGTEDQYLSVWNQPGADPRSYGGLNHIGMLVEDLDAARERVIAAGLGIIPGSAYEPGRRFYFHDHNGIEFEVLSYS